MEQINWQEILEQLANPPEGFKVFKSPWWKGLSPEEEKKEEEKILFLADKLMNEYLYLSDEYRELHVIHSLIYQYFHGPMPSAIYEFGNFSGVLGFVDILFGFKADVIFKIWDKSVWGADFARQLRNIVDWFMELLDLKRLNTSSPDERVVKLARIMGFKRDGRRKYDFRWNGEYYTDSLLGKAREK